MRWWDKAKRELSRYHRGSGQYFLDLVSVVDEPADLGQCLGHAVKVNGIFFSVRGQEDWLVKLQRKSEVWKLFLTSVMTRVRAANACS